MLQMTFDPDNHIVTHPCGHWVVKRLLGGRQKKMEEKDVEEREEEEKGLGEKEREEENERGSLFAAMILDRVEADSIRSWTSSNRGAFVVCRYATWSSGCFPHSFNHLRTSLSLSISISLSLSPSLPLSPSLSVSQPAKEWWCWCKREVAEYFRPTQCVSPVWPATGSTSPLEGTDHMHHWKHRH